MRGWCPWASAAATAAASAQTQGLCYDGMSLTIRNYCLGFVGTAVAAFLANFSQASNQESKTHVTFPPLLSSQSRPCPTQLPHALAPPVQ